MENEDTVQYPKEYETHIWLIYAIMAFGLLSLASCTFYACLKSDKKNMSEKGRKKKSDQNETYNGEILTTKFIGYDKFCK